MDNGSTREDQTIGLSEHMTQSRSPVQITIDVMSLYIDNIEKRISSFYVQMPTVFRVSFYYDNQPG